MKKLILIATLVLLNLNNNVNAQTIVEKVDTKPIAILKGTTNRYSYIKLTGNFLGVIESESGDIVIYNLTTKISKVKVGSWFQFLKENRIAISTGKNIEIYNLANLNTPIKTLEIPVGFFGISPDEQYVLASKYEKDEASIVCYLLETGKLIAEGSLNKIGMEVASSGYLTSAFSFQTDPLDKKPYVAILGKDKNYKSKMIYIYYQENPMLLQTPVEHPVKLGTNGESFDQTETTSIIAYDGLGRDNFKIVEYNIYSNQFTTLVDSKNRPEDVAQYIYQVCAFGKYLAAAVGKKTLLWKRTDQGSYQYYKTIMSDFGDVKPISISPDGKRIAVTNATTISIYNVE